MAYRLEFRAFHPDESFGLGGFGFEGDNRGFSFLPRGRVTSRTSAHIMIDAEGASIGAPVAFSDPSTSPWGVHEDYVAEGRAPKADVLAKSISPYIADGMQNIDVSVHLYGKNHAFRLSQDGGSPSWIIPDLDLTIRFSMRIDLHREEIRMTSTLTGDGFPNSEAFIRDGANTPIMLNTHHRIGQASGQLMGNHDHLLASSEIVIGCDGAGNFIGPVRAVRCVDFMPFDRDLVALSGRAEFDIPGWNGLHLARPPTEKGFLGLDTDDQVPIPGFDHEYPRDGRWGIDDIFDEPKADDLPEWDHR